MSFFRPVARFFFGGGESLKKFINDLSKIYSVNEKNSLIYAADNMILISKIAGFLKEEKFAKLANKHFLDDNLHSSIIWRIHILTWAMNSCRDLEGDFIEFGCYDAKVAEFLIEYNNLADYKKTFYLYDIFDNPPTERGEKHSPRLYDEVKSRMAAYSFVKVIKGLLPESFKKNIPKKLAFVHMDLNSAETEMSLLDLFFDKLVPGGILILDDYGTMGYEKQHDQEKKFFNDLGYLVVELPTGGGMVIKR